VPIPGTSSIARLEENIGAAAVVLNDSELAALKTVAPPGIAAGERYAPAGMAAVNH
jgi:aryl-alcohol dehydrogenase-like predicted oxidoreductase